MTPQIKLTGHNPSILETGTLKNKIPYKAVRLIDTHISSMFLFEKLIYGHLKEEEKSFFLLKSKKFLKNHFNTHSQAIGIVQEGYLVAQALLVFPSVASPETGMVDMSPIPPLHSISVFQGLSVHPELRGVNIGDLLIKTGLRASKNAGKHNILAETAQDNPYSTNLFINNGMQIVSEGTDPSDGTRLFNHHKKLEL